MKLWIKYLFAFVGILLVMFSYFVMSAPQGLASWKIWISNKVAEPHKEPLLIPIQTAEIMQDIANEYDLDVHIVGTAILRDEDYTKIERWSSVFEEAVELVPEDALVNFSRLRFVSMVDDWFTGRAWYGNKIEININPNPLHHFPFEYLSENGYSDNEMLYVWLHEFGHLWDWNYSSAQNVSRGAYGETTQGVTRYGCDHLKTTCVGEDVDSTENFAEAFALYILMPEYLQDNFPETYNWLKENTFNGKEYNVDFEPPSSLLVRLTADSK